MKKLLLAAATSAALLAAPAAAQQAPGAPEASQTRTGTSPVAAGQQAAAGQQTGGAATRTVAAVDNLRVNQLILYGEQTCPPSTEEEIIICHKVQESPYRIPAPLRDTPGPASNSWANRAMELQYVGRGGIGSCSPDGPGGASGCLVQFINQARAERQGGPAVNWTALIEQARQERLGRIDEESEAIEKELSEPR